MLETSQNAGADNLTKLLTLPTPFRQGRRVKSCDFSGKHIAKLDSSESFGSARFAGDHRCSSHCGAQKASVASRVCITCGQLNAEYLCTRCQWAHFCSLSCQRRGWSAHKGNCRLMTPPARTHCVLLEDACRNSVLELSDKAASIGGSAKSSLDVEPTAEGQMSETALPAQRSRSSVAMHKLESPCLPSCLALGAPECTSTADLDKNQFHQDGGAPHSPPSNMCDFAHPLCGEVPGFLHAKLEVSGTAPSDASTCDSARSIGELIGDACQHIEGDLAKVGRPRRVMSFDVCPCSRDDAPELAALYDRDLVQAHRNMHRNVAAAASISEWEVAIGRINFEEVLVDIAMKKGKGDTRLLKCMQVGNGNRGPRRLIGYVVYEFREKGPRRHRQRYVELVNIVVHVDYRGCGAGRALFHGLWADLERTASTQLEDLRLYVAIQNVGPLSWYRRLGFQDAGWQSEIVSGAQVHFLRMIRRRP